MRKDKSVVWEESSVNCLRKANGEIDYNIEVSKNITEKKQANFDSCQFFTLSQELLCIAGFDGYFKRHNDNLQKLLGYTQQEMLAVPFIDFVHKNDVEKTKLAIVKLSSLNKINPFEDGFENRVICKNGQMRHLLWSVVVDHQRNLMYASARDITERKLYETACMFRAKQFKALLKKAPIGIYLVDKNFRLLHHNSSALKAFGAMGDLNRRELMELLNVKLTKIQSNAFLALFTHTLET